MPGFEAGIYWGGGVTSCDVPLTVEPWPLQRPWKYSKGRRKGEVWQDWYAKGMPRLGRGGGGHRQPAVRKNSHPGVSGSSPALALLVYICSRALTMY